MLPPQAEALLLVSTTIVAFSATEPTQGACTVVAAFCATELIQEVGCRTLCRTMLS